MVNGMTPHKTPLAVRFPCTIKSWSNSLVIFQYCCHGGVTVLTEMWYFLPHQILHRNHVQDSLESLLMLDCEVLLFVDLFFHRIFFKCTTFIWIINSTTQKLASLLQYYGSYEKKCPISQKGQIAAYSHFASAVWPTFCLKCAYFSLFFFFQKSAIVNFAIQNSEKKCCGHIVNAQLWPKLQITSSYGLCCRWPDGWRVNQ
jgi:hypothetical protein